MEHISIKISLLEQGTIQRDQIQPNLSFERFVTRCLGTSQTGPYCIEYLDEENDWIHVANEEQWSHALNHHLLSKRHLQSPLDIFRIRIRRNEPPQKIPTAAQPIQMTSLQPEVQLSEQNYTPPPPPPPPAPLLTENKRAASSTTNKSNTIRSTDRAPYPPPPPPPSTPFHSSVIPFQLDMSSLAEAIQAAKNTLKRTDPQSPSLKSAIVQDYFSVSGIPRNAFLTELSQKIQVTHNKKTNAREEFEMAKSAKRSLHQELLNKYKKTVPVVESTAQSSPLLSELINRHKQFALRQVQRREELAGFELIDAREVQSPKSNSMYASSGGWLYAIISKLNF